MRTGPLPLLLLCRVQTVVIRTLDRDDPQQGQDLLGTLADLPLLMPTRSLSPRRGLHRLWVRLDEAFQCFAPKGKHTRQHFLFHSFEVSPLQFLHPLE
jgi:hypothetical protein